MSTTILRTAGGEFTEIRLKIPVVLETIQGGAASKNFPVKVDCSLTSEERAAIHGLYEGLRAMNVDLVAGTYVRPVASFADCVRSLLRSIYDAAMELEATPATPPGTANANKDRVREGHATLPDIPDEAPPPVKKGKATHG